MTRLVIANRGEIARRILRAARAKGWTVAVISVPEDRDALVRREADAVLDVPSFLAGADILEAAKAWDGRLIHPGYGFLSERADFAQAVETAGLVFVGPTAASMRLLGAKEPAKALARSCGVPVLESLTSEELASLPSSAWEALLAERGIEAPFLVKASGGGGGRGMRVVEDLADLSEAVTRASEEAQAGFGDSTVFVERYLRAPRHVEAQVFGDGQGGGVFLGERECSLQRRHQKVMEESPSSVVTPALREKIGRAALALVREARYRGAGTVEFLLDSEGRLAFLEMNTRLQVEHPVTEWVTGVDLVAAQLELATGFWPTALGDPRRFSVPDLQGVAVEARILAEDPRQGFLPTPGVVKVLREPRGEGIRVDSGMEAGGRVSGAFDSLIAKLIVHGRDRAEAYGRLARALEETVLLGCTTNLPFLHALACHPDVVAGRVSTAWIGEHLDALAVPRLPERLMALLQEEDLRRQLSQALVGGGQPVHPAAQCFARQAAGGLTVPRRSRLKLEATNLPGTFRLVGDGEPRWLTACRLPEGLAVSLGGEVLRLEDPLRARVPHGGGAQEGDLMAPMAGKVLEVRVALGETVAEGQIIAILESMKMQMEVRAPFTGIVANLDVAPGQVLSGPDRIAVIEGQGS